jgi:hypothetical protein
MKAGAFPTGFKEIVKRRGVEIQPPHAGLPGASPDPCAEVLEATWRATRCDSVHKQRGLSRVRRGRSHHLTNVDNMRAERGIEGARQMAALP